MPLIDLKTNLRSLKYGNDQRGGSSSDQPFIVTDIPEGNDVYPVSGPDFIVRNGYLNYAVNTANDVVRLSKWFIGDLGFTGYLDKIEQKAEDLNWSNFGSVTELVKAVGGESIRGIKFTAKQNLLERQNPKIFDGISRIYNPLGTIAQAGAVSSGGHFIKQGRFLRNGYYDGGRDGYFNLNQNEIDQGKLFFLFKIKKINPDKNIQFEEILGKDYYGISPASDTVNLLSYSGGPGSSLGVGKTNIRIQNPTPKAAGYIENKENGYYLAALTSGSANSQFDFPGGNGRLSVLYHIKKTNLISEESNLPFPNNYFRNKARDLYKISSGQDNALNLFSLGGPNSTLGIEKTDVRIQNPLWNTTRGNSIYGDKNGSSINRENNVRTLSSLELASQPSLGVEKNTQLLKINDFRTQLSGGFNNTSLPYSNYGKFNRELNPEAGGYGTSQTYYKFTNPYTGERVLNPNLSVSPDNTEIGVEGEDIIDFNFRLINNLPGVMDTTIDFRAYIEDFQDSYNATWDPFKYVGRADTFYKYSGINRTFNVTFVVPALSRADMISNYQKLNTLTWATMPDYNTVTKNKSEAGEGFGYMKGNFVKLTLGDYFRGMPAIINSLTFSPIMEMGFDINRYSAQDEIEDSKRVEGQVIKRDDFQLYVGQLPKGIRVQAQMTIIHGFIPQRGQQLIGYEAGSSNPYAIKENGTKRQDVRVSRNNNFVANRPSINDMEGNFY